MEEKVKEILSVFLKIPAAQINAATVIDRSAVNNSILLHRMYAKLADAGIVVNDYQQVITMGQLLKQVNNNAAENSKIITSNEVNSLNGTPLLPATGAAKDNKGIGIDIEMISAMPITADFREDNFYTMNFSASEMAYSILQPNPYASFAGMFAAKEAIVKADNTFKGIEFKNISVQHLANGKPFHPGFNISVSHTDEIAVAVAVSVQPVGNNSVPMHTGSPAPRPVQQTSSTVWLVILTSLLLSVIAIFLIAGKK